MEALEINLDSSELTDYLHACVKEASRIITPYWPISTFIASNGLKGLENLPFEQAMTYAQKLRGSQGFLPLVKYRDFFSKGRISEADLEAVITNWLHDQHLPLSIPIGNKSISTPRLYQSWLLVRNRDKIEHEELWKAVALKLEELGLPDEAETTNTKTAGDKIVTKNGQTVTEVVNRRLITWCAAFLDEGQATWAMPNRELGFYNCWKLLAELEPSKKGPQLIKTLPDNAAEALGVLLQRLGVAQDDWAIYLSRHLAQLPGWASIIQWREAHPEVEAQQHYPINLTDYLAVRLFYEVTLVAEGSKTRKVKTSQPTENPEENHRAETIERLVRLFKTLPLNPAEVMALPTKPFELLAKLAHHIRLENQLEIWQSAYEWHYRYELFRELQVGQKQAEKTTKAAVVQAIFCIDVRSEGLRRHLEKLGAYETFGFAGFFGIFMLYQPIGSSCNLTVAPALVTPTQLIRELPKAVSKGAVQRRLRFNKLRYHWERLMHTLRENLLSPFAFVEMAGWLSFFPLVGKTLSPGAWRKMQNSIQKKLSPPIISEPSIVTHPEEMSYEEQAGAVANMLRSIGLTKGFARLVLVCGHGSETENNPYASGLDCGACGGNRGGNSAFVAANVLNSPPVRRILAEKGLIIPEETFFLAGEHNTTTDEVIFLNESQLPATHRAEFVQFKQALGRAGEQNAATRWQKLPGVSPIKGAITPRMQDRAADWAQVRPEWGLVRNAAFICGSRSLTAGSNLDNRAFLHSYNPQQDSDGALLEGIMTAPMVVAEWINMQYYLSTVDNNSFGSGTKLLHTVVGQVGVMQGRQSDLLLGLPQQAVMVGEQLYHEPLRLCVIIEAPTVRIEAIVAKHPQLQQLIGNKWIELTAYESATNSFYRFSTNKEWLKVT